MEQLQHIPSHPTKGLYTDSEPEYQPENTYPFALNLVHDAKDGAKGSKVNEKGNNVCYNLPFENCLIGEIPMVDETLIISVSTTATHIGIVKDWKYTELIQTSCIPYTKCNKVKGVFKIINGCERVVALYDGVNPDLYINLDSLNDYKNQQWLDHNSQLPTVPNPHNEWDCELFKLSPNIQYPCITLEEVFDVGSVGLEVGTYSFAFAYLDAGFNEVFITDFTKQVSIIDENINNSAYADVDGATNSSSSIQAGGVLPTSKAIRFTFTNVDTSFPYYKVYVKKCIFGDGITNEVETTLNPQPITSSNINYIYKGIPLPDKEIVPLAEVTIPRPVYTVSNLMLPVNNRLTRIGLKEEVIDAGIIQQNTYRIKTKYCTKKVNVKDLQDFTPKNPLSYWTTNYMRDEVYAFGIRGLLKNSNKTLAFHIPGREAINDSFLTDQGNSNPHTRNQVLTNQWDQQLLFVTPTPLNPTNITIDLANVRHLGFIDENTDIGYGSGRVPRWLVHNTAIRLNNAEFDSSGSTGLMAYHECTGSVYPKIKLCDGSDLYGDLTGTPIRHHKFPDTTLEPIYYANDYEDGYVNNGTSYESIPQTECLYLMGIEFDIEEFVNALPQEIQDEVVEWQIMRAERDFFNKTIIDNGVLTHFAPEAQQGLDTILTLNSEGLTLENTAIIPPGWSLEEVRKNLVFISPETQFNKVPLNNYYYKFNNILCSTNFIQSQANWNTADISLGGTNYPQTGLLGNLQWNRFLNLAYDESIESLPLFRNVNSAVYVDHRSEVNSVQGFNVPVLNSYSDLDLLFSRTDDEISILGVQYPSLNTRYLYYASAKLNRDVYCDLFNVVYYPVSSTICNDSLIIKDFCGDTFISEFTFHNSIGTETSRVLHTGIYVESSLNVELRHGGVDDCAKYYKGVNLQQALGFLLNISETNEDETEDVDVCENYFAYNPDYNIKYENPSTTVPLTYDYCSKCLGHYPNRIIYSEQSFENEVSDNWKVFLANNFIDIPLTSGEITSAKFDKNQILFTTSNSLFSLSPNPQIIKTDAEQAYIGTGDFLSIPPREFVSKDYGYGGSQGKFNQVNTEYGYTWVDQKDGRVFHFSSKLDELSKHGNYHWFKNNLPSVLEKQMECKGVTLKCLDNPLVTVGVIATYDPIFERYILHKRDYEILPQLYDNLSIIDTSIEWVETIPVSDFVFDINTQTFGIVKPLLENNRLAITSISFNNSDFFCNRSWTMSYSYPDKSWVSFHSYMPDFMYHDNTTFYSFSSSSGSLIEGSPIWKHGYGNHQTFYNVKYDFIVEFVIKDSSTFDLHTAQWYSQCQLWNEEHQQWIDLEDTTFDYIKAYTRCQSTSKLKLIPETEYGNIGWSNESKPVHYTDHNYKVAQLRDLAIAQPVNTSSWDYLKEYFNINGHHGYIDKVDLPESLGKNSLYFLNDLKDKYFIIRLWFSKENLSDIKTVLNFNNTTRLYSIR